MRLAAAAALLVLAAGCCAGSSSGGLAHPSAAGSAAPEVAASARLQAPLAPQSTACALAGSWCPLEAHAPWQPDSWSHGSSSSLNSSSSGAAGASLAKSEPLPHKPLLPLAVHDVVAVVLASLALLLAASGGIGGGAILVPINLMVLGFSTSGAVALSNITIVGGTLANLAFNVGRIHPVRDAPLIDWDLIMVMEPSTILGALVGGYLNKVFPGWLTTVSLSLLLALITAKTTAKGREIHARERSSYLNSLRRLSVVNSADYAIDMPDGGDARPSPRARSPAGPLALRPGSAGSALTSDEDDASRPLLDGEQRAEAASQPATPPTPPSGLPGSPFDAGKPPPSPAKPKKAGRSINWRPHLPWPKVSVLLVLLAGVVASDIAKSHTACPSLPYWLAATAMVPVTFATLLAVRSYLLRKAAAERASGHVPVEGDVAWTSRTTLLYPAICSLAGVAAGVFGVGGGIIKGPLMLEMGVLPEVAAATSATMIFFTSASASVVFVSFGAVQWDYAAMLFTMGLLCTAVGQLLVMWVNQHLKSRALLVFVMASVLGISSVALAVQGVQATTAAAAAHDLWHFHGICGNRSA